MKRILTPRWRALLIIAVIALLGGAAGYYYSVNRAAEEDYVNAAWYPLPKSVDDIVRQADVIVIGEVGELVASGTFFGYDEQGKLIQSNNPSQQSEYFDYQVIVKEVIQDDGTIAAKQDLILRMPGKGTGKVSRSDEYPMSSPGDRHLFFLTQNPDQKTYGLHYMPRSRLMIDGPVVTFSDGKRTPVDFGGSVAPQDFIETVKTKVKAR